MEGKVTLVEFIVVFVAFTIGKEMLELVVFSVLLPFVLFEGRVRLGVIELTVELLVKLEGKVTLLGFIVELSVVLTAVMLGLRG